MFKSIEVKDGDKENITLFDTHDITVNRENGNNAEIVIHPCKIGRLTVRFAKEPYECKIYLATGDMRVINLAEEDDWGNIQQMNPYHDEWFKGGEGVIPDDWDERIGWGNDDDGHIEIVKVELLDGVPNGTEIPLAEFKQDVADFIIYYEG